MHFNCVYIAAFATSVSAKSVSLKQAVLIVSICEFLGAMLLGASVTSTIKGKIIDTELYEDGKYLHMCHYIISYID